MKNIKRFMCLLVLSVGLSASAQTTTTTNYAVGTAIPDNDATGLASTKTFSTPIVSLSDLNVSLNISGTFNGDLYAYVTHSSGFTVLLNRVGRRASDGLGYDDNGLDITLDDEASSTNVHVYRLHLNGDHTTPISGALTNSWLPDGRTNDPGVVLDTDAPASSLASFDGLDPNGTWTLFVADLSSGDISTLVSWGLEATGFEPPTITSQPQSRTNCPGTTATFSVTASGTEPFTYQWHREGTNLTDETNATLTLLNVQAGNAGNYDVLVANNYGAVTSAVATLTVLSSPNVSVNSETICAGRTATLTATTDAASPSYLWSPGGQTTPSIMVSPAMTTIYTVTVTDGTTTCQNSGSGTVTVISPPSVTVNSETVCAGGSATLTATTSASNPSYLWSPGGETNSSITVSPASTTTYTVLVTDGTTTCTNSGSGTVTVNPPPTVTVNSPSICPGDSATLTATTSAASPTYSWSPGGETTPSITVTPTTTTTYTVGVTDTATGCSNSASGTVTVRAPEVFANSSPITINDNSAATPYPSSIAVSGLTATVCRVTVTLNNLSHAFPDDVDIVLLAPNGQGVLLMSDVGNANAVSGVTLTFDDSAASSLPDSGTIVSGTYKPTNIGSKDDGRPDNFPAPVPAVRHATNLSVFSGIDPNGSWSLYVVDDEPVDTGAIAGGWSVAITTLTPFADIAVTQEGAPNPVSLCTNVTFTVTVTNRGPAAANDVTLTDTLSPNISFVSVNSSQGSCSHSAGTVSCSFGTIPAGGSVTVSIIATPTSIGTATSAGTVASSTLDLVSANNSASASVPIVDPPPAITCPANIVTVADDGQCSASNVIYTATATDNCPGVTVSCAPASGSTFAGGTTTVNCTATDSAGQTNTCSFTVTVNDTQNPSITCPANIVTNSPGNCTAVVNYSPTATDNCPGVSVNCTPPSGSTFAAGTTTVNCTATDASANTNSCSFTVTVNTAAPSIASQPQNTLGFQGNTASLSVTAAGTSPLSYQWYYNGAVLANGGTVSGATSPTLSINPANCTNSGNYHVIISNCAGSITSVVAVLTVQPISAVYFDWNTPGQFANNFALSIGALFPPFTYMQTNVNGIGNGPAVDFTLLAGGTDTTAVFTNMSYDFSYNGAVLNISGMVKIKAPTANNRVLQLGFLNRPTTLTGERLTAFMSARVNSTAQPALSFVIQTQSKVLVGTATIDGTQSGAVTLLAGNWYRLTATFTNIKATVANSFTVTSAFQDMGADGQTPGAVVLTVGPVTNAVPDIVNDTSVFAAFRGFDNAGADVYENLAVNMSTGPAAFTCQPTNRTVLQGRSTTILAYLDGATPFTYQWYKNGLAISGATDWKYSIAAVSAGDAGDYALQVTSPSGTIVSAPASLTVTPDTNRPVLLSASSLDGCIIGVCFDEALNAATATSPGNYQVNGMNIVSTAVLRPDGKSVALSVSSPVSGAFTVTVNGVQDLFGNAVAANSTVGGTVQSQMASVDIGIPLPLPAGNVYTWKDGDYEITGGGADVWGNADQFRFTYQTVSGDFDVKTLVTDETISFGNGGNIAKAGLLARETLDAGSANLDVYVMPQFAGLNRYECGLRNISGGTTGGWGTDPAGDPVNQGNIGANHPSSWLRLRRVGNTFTCYSGTNGTDWRLLGITAQPFRETLLVGIMMCSHAQGFPATSKFLNYGGFAGYPGTTLGFATNMTPTATNIQAGQTVSLRVFATGAPPSEIVYKWQRSDGAGGWTNLPGGFLSGTSNTFSLTTAALFQPDNGAQFRVLAQVTGSGAITSDVATVTVADTAAPTLSAASIPAASSFQVVVVFSEPVTAATANNAANYVVTNAAGADMGVSSAALLGSDPRTVVLTTTSALVAGNYGVRVSNVQDLNGNTIAANSLRTFSQAVSPPRLPVVVETIGAGIGGSDLAALANYTNNARFNSHQPDFISYSNIFAHQLGLADSGFNNYGARVYSYFVAPSNGLYKFWMRSDDSSRLFMNTNLVGSTTNRSGASFLGENTAVNATYTLKAQNVQLTGGQRYYMEALMKEGTGGDGVSVAVRAQSDTGTPPATEAITANMLAFPESEALPTPVIVELFTGLGGNQIADQFAAYASPGFIAGLPNFVAYENEFGAVRDLAASDLNNYLGRIISYFIPPSTGLYRFYIRSDDSCQLYMNTNANPLLSTDPAGKVLLGQINNFIGVNYSAAAQNVPLNGGQRYYLEGLYKEGTGGDGMTVAVRAQEDAAVPPNTEVIPASMLEFPTPLARIGVISLAAITPSNPTVSAGSTITFAPVGLNGALPYGFTWLKNGQVILGGSLTLTTPVLTPSDSGAVFTLVVSNAFSRVERSTMITVTADTTAPTLVSASSTPLGDRVVLTFSEPVDASAANYLLSGGVQVISSAIDPGGRIVILRTTQQSANTTYNITVIGVRDRAGNKLPDASASFRTWATGGCGLYVELFTNIAGSAVVNLTASPNYINNIVDVSGYVPSFYYSSRTADAGGGRPLGNFGPFAGNGLENYGFRVSGLFVAPSNGTYRFYLRSDDASQFFMNTNAVNSADGTARSLLINVPSANLGYGNAAAVSPNLALNAGQLYYVETLTKEGGGGDYVSVAIRPTDGSGSPIGGVPPDTEFASGVLFKTFGDPNVNQLIVNQAPPSELFLTENDPVSLTVVATILPASVAPATCYQWQKFDGAGYTNIPGATSSNLSFLAALSDDGARYRISVSLPGTNTSYVTLLHVARDTNAPYLASVGSIDGNTIGVCFNELVSSNSASDTFNWYINGQNIVTEVLPRPNPTAVFSRAFLLTLSSPITGPFTVRAENMEDAASVPNRGSSETNGTVLGMTTVDIGGPLPPGTNFTCKDYEITVQAGGADVWGTSDQFHFIYKPVDGDFDIRVRVESLFVANTWSKGGVMARETLNADSRTIQTYPTPVTGANQVESGMRRTTTGDTIDFAIIPRPATTYPNMWVRLQRSGSTFNAYSGTDGVNWTLHGQTNDAGFPSALNLGLFTTSHNQGFYTTAEFRNLRIVERPTINTQPQSITVVRGNTAVFSVGATGPSDGGPLRYQWRFGGVDMANETNSMLVINNAQPANAGNYDVVVSNSAGSTTSDVATLTVIIVDFGDAPDAPYPTLLANNGARHTIVSGFYLGAGVDDESNGQPTPLADGDGSDEDGVVSATAFVPGQMATVQVVASAAGRLDAWIDYNANGSWAEASDRVANNVPLAAGVNTLNVPVTSNAVHGPTYARLRFSSAGGLSFDGPAADGEVEDYVLLIENRPPVAVNDNIGAAKNTPRAIPASVLLANDSDPDMDTLTVTSVSSPSRAGGTVILASGTVTYTPPANFMAGDIFTYTISDAHGGSATGTVCVTVSSAPLAYREPLGGWAYVFTADSAAGQPRTSNTFALDGTWRHSNGSDEWFGDGRGAGNGPAGGVSANNGIVTIEDAVMSTSGTTNNRKIYLTHDVRQNGVTGNGWLDAGVTLSFRTRLTPPDGLNEISLPNGWGIFSDGKGNFGVRQSSPSAVISFSLVQATEDFQPSGTPTTMLFPSAGLLMNKLNGDVPGTAVDANETGGTTNLLALDPTVFHEFWITIQTNDATAGNGTHTVRIYIDGNTNPAVFNVTAGTGNDPDTTIAPNWTDYVALGLNNSPTVGAFDTDFYAFKAGVLTPASLNDPEQPVLSVVRQGTNVVISWPQTCGPFALEQTMNLNPPISWLPSGATITPDGSRYSATIPISSGNRFYRLKQ